MAFRKPKNNIIFFYSLLALKYNINVTNKNN